MADTFYTADELAALLKVTPQAIYNWIQQGRMEAVRIGRTVRIPAAEVERVLREGRTVRHDTTAPDQPGQTYRPVLIARRTRPSRNRAWHEDTGSWRI